MHKRPRLIPACMACFGLSLSASAVMADDADLFKQLDTSGDGVVEKSEVDEERVRFFERLIRVGDENEDGKLSQDEFNAALAEPKPDSPQTDRMGPGGRRGFGQRPGGPPQGGMPSPAEVFERLDANKDGKIQRDELNDRAQMLGRLMDRLETDEITQEQLEQAATRMREMMGNRGDGQGRPGSGRPDGPPSEGDRRDGDRREGDRREGDRRPGPDGERGSRGPEMADGDGFRPREGFRPRGDDRDFGPRGGDMARREGEGRPDGPPMGRGDRGSFGPPAFLRLLDENEDGKITKLEAVRLIELFGELDHNGDGTLEPAELMGQRGGPMGPPNFGRDGDRPERGRPDGPPFARGDRDGMRPGPPRDGDRPRPEGRPDGDRPPRPEGDRPQGDLPQGDRPEGDRPGMRRGDGDRPGVGRRGGEGGPFRGNAEAFFERLDRDGNGEVAQDELPEFLRERFGMMDRNDDGKLTKEEFRRPEGAERGPRGDRRPGGDGPRGDGPRGERPRPARPEVESDDGDAKGEA